MEIHDELAAQIANHNEEVEYIDGVPSIEEEDEDSELNSAVDSLPVDAGNKAHEGDDEDDGDDDEDEEVQVDTFRVIGIRRQLGQCLGLTVRMEAGKVTVARILIDSLIDRQNLVRQGDVILQANGVDVKDPDKLLEIINKSNEFLVLKIQPSPVIDYAAEENLIAHPKTGKVEKVSPSPIGEAT